MSSDPSGGSSGVAWPDSSADRVLHDAIAAMAAMLSAPKLTAYHEGVVLDPVRLLDEMDEQMWTLLQKNIAGLTEEEADWRPHPAANSVRWMLGHLAWFEEWAHDALGIEGRYLVDANPTACLEGTIPEVMARFAAARRRYRARLTDLGDADLARQLSYFARYNVTGLGLLETHAMHLAGHRFQVRYVRGTYSRAHGTSKAFFDPW